MIRLVLVALSLTLPGCVTPPATPAATELCEVGDDGTVRGVDPWPCQHLVDRYATLVTRAPIPGTMLAGRGEVMLLDYGPGFRWRIEFEAAAQWDSGTQLRHKQFRAGVGWHEVGHRWLYAEFDGVAHADTFTAKYGTPAPDWFDEGWAVWAEGSAQRTQRMERMPLDVAPSLAALVTMRHPIQAQRDLEPPSTPAEAGKFSISSTVVAPCTGDCSYLPDSALGKYFVSTVTRSPSGRMDTTNVYLDSTQMAARTRISKGTFEAEHFYPLTYSLLRYIRETGGEAAVRALLDRYRADPTPRVEALAGLPGLPASTEALERGWHAFLKERRAEPE
jgi:hypothetical protein